MRGRPADPLIVIGKWHQAAVSWFVCVLLWCSSALTSLNRCLKTPPHPPVFECPGHPELRQNGTLMAMERVWWGYGGGTEGERWGKGGGRVASRIPSSVPFWHTSPFLFPMSTSNRCPNRSSGADSRIHEIVAADGSRRTLIQEETPGPNAVGGSGCQKQPELLSGESSLLL